MRLLFALLLSLAALVASSHVVPNGGRHPTRETRRTETQAPTQGSNDAWQSATRVATTTESASVRTLHIRAVAAISDQAPFLQRERRIHGRVDAVRDRSPHHPIPLLI